MCRTCETECVQTTVTVDLDLRRGNLTADGKHLAWRGSPNDFGPGLWLDLIGLAESGFRCKDGVQVELTVEADVDVDSPDPHDCPPEWRAVILADIRVVSGEVSNADDIKTLPADHPLLESVKDNLQVELDEALCGLAVPG